MVYFYRYKKIYGGNHMNPNSGKNFIWLFAGLFAILFTFASVNEARGTAIGQRSEVTIDHMIQAIVESDTIVSDNRIDFPDSTEIPIEYAMYLTLKKEAYENQKTIGNMLYIHNTNTSISSLVYIMNDDYMMIYNTKEGLHVSDDIFRDLESEVISIYNATL